MMKIVISLIILFKISGLDSYGTTCTTHANCTNLHEVCVDSKCTCRTLTYLDDTTKTCLAYATEYKGSCLDTKQCTEYLGNNIECSKSECVCKDGYRWFGGKCVQTSNFGGECQADVNCYNGYDLRALKCTTNECVCSDDYYNRENTTDCRLKSKEKGVCAIDNDCQNSELKCIKGICSKNNTPKSLLFDSFYKTQLREETVSQDNLGSCTEDTDCFLENTHCNNNICQCESNYYSMNGYCAQGIHSCESDGDCSNFTNSFCFKSASCVCKQGYFLSDGSCVPELGLENSCQKNSDCLIQPSQCINNACYCKDYWFTDDKNQHCTKTSISTNLFCLSNDWCNVLGPYSFCKITTDGDNLCTCSSNAVLNAETTYCDVKNDPPKDFCLRDDDCNLSEICVNEKCECQSDYYKKNDDCVPKIGTSCEVQACQMDNSECSKAVCVCENNYVTDDKEFCYEIAPSLNSSCLKSVQCYTTVQFSECKNKKCVCEDKYKDVKGECYERRDVGSPCQTSSDCTIVLNDSFECRKNICQCPVSYTLKDGYCSGSSQATLGYVLLIITVIYQVFG